MEDFQNLGKTIKSLEKEGNLLENLIALQARRSSIIPELEELKNYSDETRNNIERFKQILEEELDPLMDQVQKQKLRVHQQQIQMLTIMKVVNTNKQKLEKNILNSVSKSSLPNPPNVSSLRSQVIPIDNGTPGIYLTPFSDNTRTPLHKANNPCRLLNFDFDPSHINQQMFDEIPKYMKGRISLDELNTFLLNVIIACFNEKYQLLQRNRETVKHKELCIWNAYKAQSSLFPNQKFITQGDISRKCNKLIDKKISDKLTMLRHLKVLQEKRKESTICYIWLEFT